MMKENLSSVVHDSCLKFGEKSFNLFYNLFKPYNFKSVKSVVRKYFAAFAKGLRPIRNTNVHCVSLI